MHRNLWKAFEQWDPMSTKPPELGGVPIEINSILKNPLSKRYYVFLLLKTSSSFKKMSRLIGGKSNPNLELLFKDDPWGNLNFR